MADQTTELYRRGSPGTDLAFNLHTLCVCVYVSVAGNVIFIVIVIHFYSQFGVLDSAGEVVPLRERLQEDVYSEDDPIGLRQLDTMGGIVEHTVPGVGHHEWHCNEQVLRECIIDWLD